MMNEQEKATYQELKNGIRLAFWEKVGYMVRIEDEWLYRDEYATFSDWLMEEYPKLTGGGKGKSESTWRQWKASYKAYQLAQSNGVELSNDHAARALRKVEDSLRALVVNRAVDYQEMKTGEKPKTLTAAMIVPVVDEIKQVIDDATATGHVDTGNGSMSGFAAAVEVGLQERILRQRQHIRDASKLKWSEPIRISGKDGFAYPGDWFDAPDGSTIEIKWRIVDETE
jgi:hypothetical protein